MLRKTVKGSVEGLVTKFSDFLLCLLKVCQFSLKGSKGVEKTAVGVDSVPLGKFFEFGVQVCLLGKFLL